MSSADRPDPTDLDNYARAAAHFSGLAIDAAWWPAVRRHLALLLEHAARLECLPPGNEEDEQSLAAPAPVFQP